MVEQPVTQAMSSLDQRRPGVTADDAVDLVERDLALVAAGAEGTARHLLDDAPTVARALALEPKLLLLDEPCAGMTSEEKQDMIFWIKDIQDDLGITILLIEHDMRMVMDISDEIVVLSFGCKIAEDEPLAIQQDPEVIKIYLGEDEEEAA